MKKGPRERPFQLSAKLRPGYFFLVAFFFAPLAAFFAM
jgi:hypothetical protein